MKLTDCMQKQAIELIMIDPELNIIDRRLRHEWQTKLSVRFFSVQELVRIASFVVTDVTVPVCERGEALAIFF